MNKEIIWNIVNSLLAGALVLMGAISTGELTLKGILLALVAGGVVAITNFKNYWASEKPEYDSPKLFNFIPHL